MAITIDGLISGLDTTGIITKLMDIERQPIKLMERKQDAVDEKLLAWQELNSKLLSFETVAQKFNSENEFLSISGSFTNNNSLQGDIVGITTNSNIAADTYSLTVNQLATQHKMVSDQGFATSGAISGLDSFTITLGDGTTQTFTETEMGSLKDAINASTLGLTARIINVSATSTPSYYMQIVGDEVGAEKSFTTSAAYLTGMGGTFPDIFTFSASQLAQYAQFELDGLSIERASNIFDDVITGVELELTAAGSGTLTFDTNTDGIVDNIEEFVDAYNEVMAFIKEQFAYNADTRQKNPLFGNSTLRNIQMKLKNIVTGQVSGLSSASGWYTGISQIGITTNLSDQLEIDRSTLVSAIKSNVTGIKNLFVPSGSGTYTFVGTSGATVAGAYDTRYITDSNGNLVLQMRLSGSSGSWITLKQSGDYWYGQSGTDLNGLSILATGLSENDTGTMSIATGIAESVSYYVGYYTEFSTEGAIFNVRRHLENENKEYSDQISDLEERIKNKKSNLERMYAQLEVTLSNMKTQSDYLSQQLTNLPGYMAVGKS
ncbi:MAG: flagellar filament capping protein FliD [Nitrospinota bacterium]